MVQALQPLHSLFEVSLKTSFWFAFAYNTQDNSKTVHYLSHKPIHLDLEEWQSWISSVLAEQTVQTFGKLQYFRQEDWCYLSKLNTDHQGARAQEIAASANSPCRAKFGRRLLDSPF